MNALTKTLLVTFGIAAGMIACSNIASAASLKDTFEASKPLHNKGRFVCSAVVVSPTQLVTAAHCIPNNTKDRKFLTIELVDYARGMEVDSIKSTLSLNVDTIRVDKDDDTAVLELRSKDHSFDKWVSIPEAMATPEPGDQLYAIGYPRGHELTITEGMFTAETTLSKDMGVKGDFWKVTVPITGGSSGGGLYQREWDPVEERWDFRLVGLATAGYRDVSFQNYFSTFDALKKVVRNLLVFPEEVKGTETDMNGNEVILEKAVENSIDDRYLDAWKDLER